MNSNDSTLDDSISSKNSSINFVCSKVHVLLVEHETIDHDIIMKILNYLSYKVTSVKLASTALSILSKGKVRFDLALVNMNSPDLLGGQLLHDATKIDLPLIFMTNVDDYLTSLMALEHGAYLCVKKPMTMATLGCLWQFVLREKGFKHRETKAFAKLMGDYHLQQEREYFGKFIVESHQDDGNNNNNNTRDLVEKQKSINSLGASSSSSQHGGTVRLNKRKDWLEWTVELHDKFMAAARQLGQGKCYPKDILDIMNVPGLSRMQVASHLQKCRNAKWLPPNERSSKAGNNGGTTQTKPSKIRAKTVRFGLMPYAENKMMKDHHPQSLQADHKKTRTSGAAESSNHRRRRLDLNEGSYYPMDHHQEPAAAVNNNNKNSNMSLDEQFIHGEGDNTIFAPLTDILSNFAVAEDPFQMLPTVSSSMVNGFSDIRQDFDTALNGNWPSFMPGDEVVGATDEWLREALNPDVEKEESEQGKMMRKKGK